MPDSPRFAPWIGGQFQSGLRGTRLLVVGESHYGTQDQNDNSDVTRRCISNVVAGHWKLKFFRNIQSLFVDLDVDVAAPTTEEHRTKFWNRIAFYNFVQEFLPGPGVAPHAIAWKRDLPSFNVVLAELVPTCVLFACKRLFVNTAAHFEAGPALDVEDRKRRSAYVPAAEGRAVASFILHPSYRGYRKQAPWVDALLQRAAQEAPAGAK